MMTKKYWILYEMSNEGNEGGTGKATFIDEAGKWQKLKGIKCIFETK